MAKNVQADTADRVQARIRSQAHNRVAAVLTAKTGVPASVARDVAGDLVDAAAPHIRAQYAGELAGLSGAQATRLGAAAIGLLTLDLTVFATVAARGPRWVRPVAAAAVVAHTAFFVVNKRRVERMRAAARVEVARDSARAAA
jgi:hypothetical protein